MASNISTFIIVTLLVAGALLGQTTVIQTPFGPKEIEVPAATPGQQPQPAPPGPPQAAPAANQPPPSTPAAAQPAPQTSQPQADEVAAISLHLDNTDIYQVIRIIGDYLQLNYIIDPAVKGTVNINTAGQLRRSDLLPILETILKING